jgi:hypothetical protein
MYATKTSATPRHRPPHVAAGGSIPIASRANLMPEADVFSPCRQSTRANTSSSFGAAEL